MVRDARTHLAALWLTLVGPMVTLLSGSTDQPGFVAISAAATDRFFLVLTASHRYIVRTHTINVN